MVPRGVVTVVPGGESAEPTAGARTAGSPSCAVHPVAALMHTLLIAHRSRHVSLVKNDCDFVSPDVDWLRSLSRVMRI